MQSQQTLTIDGNQAAATVAHKLNEVIAIYPITPSSNMGEWADEWSSRGQVNLWGTVPQVTEMQSEAGAAGAIHGALQAGSMATTFTASQGLLLMLPNMYKIAGELTPTVFHIAARSLACQGLSIFGDHSDVMSARMTGFGMLCSNSPQEVMDFALIAHAAALEGRIPLMHFFDGFRTSHEIAKISLLDDDVMRAMINEEWVVAHRSRALSPDNPVLRGTAQNPDVYFQARESVNAYYQAMPGIVQNAMDRFAKLTGRSYRLFEYLGSPDAERVIVMMGSGAEAVAETLDYLNRQANRSACLKCVYTGPSMPPACLRRCLRPAAKSRCWTAPKSRARMANRCIRTCLARWPRILSAARLSFRYCRKWLAAVTACLPRNSRPA
jgi:domain.